MPKAGMQGPRAPEDRSEMAAYATDANKNDYRLIDLWVILKCMEELFYETC